MIEKVISGGQTGVGRAALDVAMEFCIPCGGWCPHGRSAEDGPIDSRYPLAETGSADSTERRERNILEADGTLIITIGKPTEGKARTIELARRHKRPYWVVDLEKAETRAAVTEWIEYNNIRALNVAGPRESKRPGIYDRTTHFLREIFQYIYF